MTPLGSYSTASRAPTFLAHVTASNLAPVLQARLAQTMKGSSQAVIRLANSGTSNFRSSSSVRVQTMAAINPPAEVPVMTLGRRPSSRKAFTTPKWSEATSEGTDQVGCTETCTHSSQMRHHQRDKVRKCRGCC
jgi:hypothetical protein